MDRLTWWGRLRRVNPAVWDALLAAALLIAQLAPSVVAGIRDRGPTLSAGMAALIVLACATLAFRRRAPITVLAIVAAATTLYAIAGYQANLEVPPVFAAYTAASRRERRDVVTIALPIALVAAIAITLPDPTTNNWVEDLIAILTSTGIPMLVGRVMFNRRRRIAGERDQAALDAVTAERARMARELHDVVAHAMSVMVVQAGAARTTLAKDPAAAEEAIRRIEETGRSALGEMRRLVALLRPEDDDALAPQPSLSRIDELLDGVRRSGLPVEVVVEGTPRDVAPGIDLTAYRIVQEGLTNALRHAGNASARVVLRYGADALQVEVADDGAGPVTNGDGGPSQGRGHGLIGMRERVALLGGTLETGARPGGGFLVRAELPLLGDVP
jgi:signal transduction histidine kinase